MNEKFGEYLKRMREQQELTLKQLSELSGVSIAQLSRLENGLRDEPRQETIKKLATALKSTTYVELMAAAGYLDNLNSEEMRQMKQNSEIADALENANKNPQSVETEKEFVENLEFSDGDLLKKFNPKLDGLALSEDEYREMISYIRVKRQMAKLSDNDTR